jgi:hypothetical protein
VRFYLKNKIITTMADNVSQMCSACRTKVIPWVQSPVTILPKEKEMKKKKK